MKTTFNKLFQALPPVILRCRVGELTNGAVSPRTLANHDSAMSGPSERFLINGKVAYTREHFLDWLCERSRILRALDDTNNAGGSR